MVIIDYCANVKLTIALASSIFCAIIISGKIMKKLHSKLFIATILLLFALTPIITMSPHTYADQNIEVTDTGTGTPSTTTNNSSSFSGRCEYFLGMVSWDCNVDIHDEDSLKSGIWIIVSNIASDISIAASYLIIAYVIYGGYLYVFSRGEAGKVAEGKKTLTQAFIGLGIVMTATIIMNTIRIALGNVKYTENCTTGDCGATPDQVVIGFINWVIGIAGVMSVIFVVYGGLLYITSTGDPSKVKQAKNMITYSLIGLAIVALSATITAFVSQSIREASESAYMHNILISKEIYEIKNM